jgi:hypothetical protein
MGVGYNSEMLPVQILIKYFQNAVSLEAHPSIGG